LTLDVALQRSAESLLDAACRARPGGTEPPASGGAIVVMDVTTGELLVAASAPRFDPAWFAQGDARSLAALFESPNDPLVDRVAKMAIPPGSVFKTLAAIALVESHACDPEEEFHCQGYLHAPDRQRCLIFRQQGIGHGEVTLAAALAESCNVFFLHHASELGPEPLISWAKRFGFGRPSGVDLPDEAAGNLPHSSPDDPRVQRLAAAQGLAIGQGTLSVTPLQVARMMAAVANGGKLLRPRIVLGDPASGNEASSSDESDRASSGSSEGESIPVSELALRAVREGLRRTVADPRGTAYGSARLASVAIAGKTGTAQTAGADHAWFAGYAPADEPRVAIVVVLEHGGHAAGAARMARDLVVRLHRLGYLGAEEHDLAAE
jgi:penicillin-binding protein 2